MNETKKANKNTSAVPALLIAGGACALLPSAPHALELGTLEVQSTLGQPLRASVAYALNSGEQLNKDCVSLRTGVSDNGLHYLSRARITVTDSAILFASETPIKEPMLAMQVSVSCPYTARLARGYTLMIDPARPEPAAALASVRRSPAPAAARVSRTAAPAAAPRRSPADESPIASGSRYQVQPGDSLSAIVMRIPDRSTGLSRSMQAIFTVNPHAFIDGDRNLLKAGAWLDVPDLRRAAADLPAAKPEPTHEAPVAGSEAVVEETTATSRPVYEPPAVDTDFDSGFTPSPDEIATPLESEPPVMEPEATAEAAVVDELRPGDVFIGSDSPFVSPIDSGDGPSDELAIGEGNDAAPDRAVPIVVTRSGDAATVTSENSWSWLLWLGGAGLAIIVALAIFGRRIRNRFGRTPAGAFAQPAEERRAPNVEQPRSVVSDVDFDFEVPTSSMQPISLDADLGEGTGLSEGSDIDVAQDFGFSASGDAAGEMDMELPEYAAEPAGGGPTTEVIPPQRADESSILESEIPPDDEASGEYDLSMIVDATKQSLDQTNVTAKDLHAVQIGASAADADDYTLNKEVDYQILEQDYEEEFTQTQALNEEIAKAALELAASMDADEREAETAEVPAVDPAEFDTGITREMPANDDSVDATSELTSRLPFSEAAGEDDEQLSDLDDTGVNEELAMPGDEATAEMPAAQNDPTVDMDVEGGRVDTKKSVG